jgi:hypothetical protein
MNAQKVPNRYNLMKITIWSAVFAPMLFELINWLTGFALMKYGVMERWPIFMYMSFAFIIGTIIQKLEYVKPDLLARLFLMMCWIFAFFVSSLFWESLLREIPQGETAVIMILLYPTLITGACLFLGLSIREVRNYR